MIIYQIRIKGPDLNTSSSRTIMSKKVFRTRESAKAFAPTFESQCTAGGLFDIEKVDEREFVELELED
jgi:hypothetical protein